MLYALRFSAALSRHLQRVRYAATDIALRVCLFSLLHVEHGVEQVLCRVTVSESGEVSCAADSESHNECECGARGVSV